MNSLTWPSTCMIILKSYSGRTLCFHKRTIIKVHSQIICSIPQCCYICLWLTGGWKLRKKNTTHCIIFWCWLKCLALLPPRQIVSEKQSRLMKLKALLHIYACICMNFVCEKIWHKSWYNVLCDYFRLYSNMYNQLFRTSHIFNSLSRL